MGGQTSWCKLSLVLMCLWPMAGFSVGLAGAWYVTSDFHEAVGLPSDNPYVPWLRWASVGFFGLTGIYFGCITAAFLLVVSILNSKAKK